MFNLKTVSLFLIFVVFNFNYLDRINLKDNSVVKKQDEPTYEETRSWILEKLKVNVINEEEDDGYGNGKQHIYEKIDIFTEYFYCTKRSYFTESYIQSSTVMNFRLDVRDFKEIEIVKLKNSSYMYIKTNSKSVRVENNENWHMKQPTKEEYLTDMIYLPVRTSIGDDMEDRFNNAFNHLKKLRNKKNPLTSKKEKF